MSYWHATYSGCDTFSFPCLDFTLLTQQVMITPTQSQPCVDFIAIADSLGLEGDETLSLNLTGPDNVIFGISTLDITITDADGTYIHAYTVHTMYMYIKYALVMQYYIYMYFLAIIDSNGMYVHLRL